jgi:hypothetical protein
MAHTYEQLPVSIPSLFEKIVSDVSANLRTELGRDVQFLYGSYNHIRQRLASKDKSEGNKEVKYPLIALIYSFDERKVSGKDSLDVSLTFLICTESENSMYSEDRYTQNYLPILYPIYAEFMAVVESSNYFRKYHSRGVPHVKVDDLHMGEESGGGKIAYILPDVVDGIWIKDLELSVLPNMCTLQSWVVPSLPQLLFYSAVTNIDVTYSGDEITLNFEGEVIDVNNVAPSIYYLLDKGTGTFATDVTAYAGQDPYTFSVSAYADGEYIGYIKIQDGITTDARLGFWFKVQSGKVVAAMSNSYELTPIALSVPKFTAVSNVQSTEYNLTFFDYLANNDVDPGYSHVINGLIKSLEDVDNEYIVSRSSSFQSYKQKIRVSTKTINSTIIYKIN